MFVQNLVAIDSIDRTKLCMLKIGFWLHDLKQPRRPQAVM